MAFDEDDIGAPVLDVLQDRRSTRVVDIRVRMKKYVGRIPELLFREGASYIGLSIDYGDDAVFEQQLA